MSERSQFSDDLRSYGIFVNSSWDALRAGKPPIAAVLENSRLKSRLSENRITADELVGRMASLAETNSVVEVKFPWSERKVDLFELYAALAPFFNDLRVKPHLEYYPSDVVKEMTSDLYGMPDLSPESQLNLMGKYSGNFWSDVYGLALTWRNIARGHDSVLGRELCSMSHKDRCTLLTRLETFPSGRIGGKTVDINRQISANGGDWYHFLTMTALKSAVDSEKHRANGDAQKALILDQLLYRSASLSGLRGKKVGSGTHFWADKLGYQAGILVAENIQKKTGKDFQGSLLRAVI